MKQWIPPLAVSLFSITLFTGCVTGSPEGEIKTPEEGVKAVASPEDAVKKVVNTMFEATKVMDFDAVGECLAPDQVETVKMVKGVMEMMPAEEFEKQKAKMVGATITLGEVIITGDTATCETIIKRLEGANEQKDTVSLKKVDGKWYFSELP